MVSPGLSQQRSVERAVTTFHLVRRPRHAPAIAPRGAVGVEQGGAAQVTASISAPLLDPQDPETAQAAERAIERSRSGAALSVPSHREHVQDTMMQVAAKIEAAERVGVRLDRLNFMSKLLGAGMAAVAVGVAAALTGATFGAGAALLAIASVRLAIAVGDAVCAYRVLQDRRETPPKNSLPLKSSAIGNALFFMFSKAGMPRTQAIDRATRASVPVSVGLAVVAMSLGQVAAAPDAVGTGLRVAAGGLLGLMWARDMHVNDEADRTALAARQARRAVVRRAVALTPAETRQVIAWMDELLGSGVASRTLRADLAVSASGDLQRPGSAFDLAPVRNRAIANVARDAAALNTPIGLGVSLARRLAVFLD